MMRTALQELRDVDSSSPKFNELLSQITSNFDKFEDDGNLWCSSKAVSRKDKDHEFIGYTFKRKKVVVCVGWMYRIRLDWIRFLAFCCMAWYGVEVTQCVKSQDVVRAALTAEMFGMSTPPGPASKRPHNDCPSPCRDAQLAGAMASVFRVDVDDLSNELGE